MIGLALALAYIFYFIINRIFRADYKVNKIKKKRIIKSGKGNAGPVGRLADQLVPIVNTFSNEEKIKYKLIQSGGSFSNLGVTAENFRSFEVLFAAVVALVMILTNSSLTDILLYPAISIAYVETIVRISTRKRQEKIKNELELLIVNTKDYVEQGMDIRDIFALLPSKLQPGPLKEELVRLSTRLFSLKLSSSIEQELWEFARRIGLEEVDNYILALTQHEITGRVTRMLEKQEELLRSQKNQRVKSETQRKASISSVASILVVIMTLTVIIVPMVILVLQNKLFAR